MSQASTGTTLLTWDEYDVQVLLRDLGMSARTEWRQVEEQLRDLDMDVSGALEQKERQRLFLEVRGELAAEQGFKALLESAPDISAATSWPLAKRQVCPFLCDMEIAERAGAFFAPTAGLWPATSE